MGFLNPAYLAALAAVAIPLLIHILSRRRVPVINFSSLRFLQPSDRRSMKRVNLRRLFLLLLRMIGIALIVLAFTQPTMKGRLATLFPSESIRACCILLDRSYSMGLEQEGGSLFDEARRRVIEILGEYTPEDEVMIVLFDSSQEFLYRGRMDGPLIGELLSETVSSWGTTDLSGAFGAGIEMLDQARGGAKELYVVSDFQRSSLGLHRSSTAQSASGREREVGLSKHGEDPKDSGPIRIFLVPLKAESEMNVSIERVGVPRTAIHRGELASVELLVRNSGSGSSERFPLELYIDGRLVIEKEIVIKPNGYAKETFALPTERNGWIFGEAKKTPDRLRADDRRYFVLHVTGRVKVLLVADQSAFYLEQALEPEGVEGDIELMTRTYSGLTSTDLDGTDVVVLGPGGEPRQEDLVLLERFVESGGRMVVFIVPELASVADRLSAYPLSMDFPDLEEGFLTISEPTSGNRFLGPFDADDIEAMTKLRFLRAAVVSGVPDARGFLFFSSGSPFMWEERRGEGGCLFVAADPRPGSGDLVLSPYFLPLVQQSVLEVVRRGRSEEGIIIGEPLALPVAASGEMSVGLLQGLSAEGPETFIMSSVDQEEWFEGIGSGKGAVPVVGAPGFVAIESGGETLDVFAANVAGGAESELMPAPGEEVADSLGIEHWMTIEKGRSVEEAVRYAREGREITFGLIMAAALILVIESILSQAQFEGKSDVG